MHLNESFLLFLKQGSVRLRGNISLFCKYPISFALHFKCQLLVIFCTPISHINIVFQFALEITSPFSITNGHFIFSGHECSGLVFKLWWYKFGYLKRWFLNSFYIYLSKCGYPGEISQAYIHCIVV